MLLAVLAFIVFFAGIWLAYWGFIIRPEQQAAGAVRRRLRATKDRASIIKASIVADQERMSSIAYADAVLKGGRFGIARLNVLVQQSGVQTTVAVVLLACGVLMLIGFIAVQMLTGYALLGLAAGVLLFCLPIQTLSVIRDRRMRKFEDQFPEALDLISRALRAGHAFTTGIEMVAKEMPKPVGPEYQLLYDQQNYGMPMPEALRAFAERIPVLDARFFATAVLIQRDSGGNLSEVLDNLAGVIRERHRVKRQMRVLSAHGRITGWVLVALPPVLGTVLMTISPENRRTMFGDPLGIQMMIAAAVLQLIGTLIMRKIINIEY
jgi:tight adherence protein B